MSLIFKNDVCTCKTASQHSDIVISLIKPYNQLQIEQRNSITIATRECELYLTKIGYVNISITIPTSSKDIYVKGYDEQK